MMTRPYTVRVAVSSGTTGEGELVGRGCTSWWLFSDVPATFVCIRIHCAYS